MHRRHPLLIPAGSFCYSVISSAIGDALSPKASGRRKRYGDQEEMGICPYWIETDHGTVRCDYLGIEVLSFSAGALDAAMQHFGPDAELDFDSLLADKIKACNIRSER